MKWGDPGGALNRLSRIGTIPSYGKRGNITVMEKEQQKKEGGEEGEIY